MASIDIKQLDVVFGKAQKQALALLDEGYGRSEIKQQTGAVVGVENANISVKEGDICVLMGLSGSGKSSLLRTINGLNAISRGHVLVESIEHGQVDVASCSANLLRHLRTDDVSMVFQKFALMPWLSVLDNVAFGLQMKGMSKVERHKKAMEKLDIVGLREWAKSKPHELSGGMQQRVGLARAFATESHILLMDEPFSALDPLIRTRLQDDLLDLQRELKKTIVFVSHDLDEALKLGTNIAIMQDGKIIQHNAPEEIVLNPSTEYVRNFVMHTNPLNVLTASSLMSPRDKLPREGDRYYLSKQKRYWVELDEHYGLMAAGMGETQFPIATLDALEVPRMTFSIASKDSSMRKVIEQRYDSLLPVLVVEGDKLQGVLNDSNFYYALLGKHFEEE